MNLFFPRRVLAVIFSALLGVVAFSSIAGTASAAISARVVSHDSRSTMKIVDDESWPSSDEVQPQQRALDVRLGGGLALHADHPALRRRRGRRPGPPQD
jgi:hypothetical protein